MEERPRQGNGDAHRGRGKRRMERGGGIAKRTRMERRDESEESRSGSARDRPGRGDRRVARPMTPPHHPSPPSITPRRSPRLTTSAVRDLRNLPLAAKTERRTAHSLISETIILFPIVKTEIFKSLPGIQLD